MGSIIGIHLLISNQCLGSPASQRDALIASRRANMTPQLMHKGGSPVAENDIKSF